MKKVMWFISLIPLVVTSFILQFFPDKIPMHYDLEGNIDRWGNKAESLIFPIIILFISLFWTLFIYHFEKKIKTAKTEKDVMEAKSNAKILSIVGICMAVMFSFMHFFSMYSSYVEAIEEMEHAKVNIANVSCVLLGIMFIVLGNFIPKTKKNGTVGVRTVWSMYNDNTWRKSNLFGGAAMVIIGVLTIITSIFVSGGVSTVLMLVYLLIFVIATVAYSKKVYNQENK